VNKKTREKPEKNLNARIEDLVNGLEKSSHVIEKRFSYKMSFFRGVVQGLGIVVGSTIVAGIAYTLLTYIINPKILHTMTIESAIEKSLEK
jgi:hypothetical protein